jgi:hypothetical protein
MYLVLLFKYKNERLKTLINYTREWHYSLMPKYEYNYFLERIEKFGNTPHIKVYNLV